MTRETGPTRGQARLTTIGYPQDGNDRSQGEPIPLAIPVERIERNRPPRSRGCS